MISSLLINLLSDVIANKCLLCKHQVVIGSKALCSKCWGSIVFITDASTVDSLYAHIAEGYIDRHHGIYTAIEYNSAGKKLIHALKYKSPYVLCDLFAKWLFLFHQHKIAQYDVIIPVPIHNIKLKKRGYNQAAILAKRLSGISCKKYLLDMLIKTRNTKSQTLLNQHERLYNIANTFAINPKYSDFLSYKNVLLVDDVITTGATVVECANTLFASRNIRGVACISAAKTVF